MPFLCRSCHHPIQATVSFTDFENAEQLPQSATSKVYQCSHCGTPNVRYFAWENEFGDVRRPFAAAPTAREDSSDEPFEWWEVAPAEPFEPEGSQRLGTDDSFLEISWNLAHRVAFLTLFVAAPMPVECWQYRFDIPQGLDDVDVLRHLYHLVFVLQSLYQSRLNAVDIVPQLAGALLDFRHFLEGL
jgi:hypothetical protein